MYVVIGELEFRLSFPEKEKLSKKNTDTEIFNQEQVNIYIF